MRGRRVFIIGAIAAFLIFTVATVYPMLFPVLHWEVDCYAKRGGLELLVVKEILTEQGPAETFAALHRKRGKVCTVTAVTEPYRLYRDYVSP